jgi:hypothetical protein
VSRPTHENTVDDLRANTQNKNEIVTMGIPTRTTSVSSNAAVPRMTGKTDNTIGSPHVVNEGTTAVAMIEDAMVR